MAKYQAILEGNPKEGYSVRFPHFPGCVTAGDTVDETLFLAEEALSLHIEGMLDDGENVDTPLYHADLGPQPGEILALVEVDVKPRKNRFNVSLDNGLVRFIDGLVQSGRYESRSAFLAEAARRELSGLHS